MKAILVSILAVLACNFSHLQAAPTQFAIDLDSSRLGSSDVSGPFATQSGFTSWDVTTLATSGNTLTLDGLTFELFGFSAVNQSRVRTTGGGGGSYDSLLADFAYNEGAAGRAIGLRITGLEPATYQMQSWHYDSASTVLTTENFIRIEARNMGDSASTVTLLTRQPFGLDPLAFSFDVTAVGQIKEIIFREDDSATETDPTDQNRARLNGFIIVVPEPGSLSLLLLGAAALSFRRR